MYWDPDPWQFSVPGLFYPPSPEVPKDQQDVMSNGDERWIGGKLVRFKLIGPLKSKLLINR